MSDLTEYGEHVTDWGPFRLDCLDHRHHRKGAVHWRLSFSGAVIGYTSTDDPDNQKAAVTKLFEEKAKRAQAWEQEPAAIVRRKRGGSVEAMFLHPRDATEFVAAQRFPASFTIENVEGRKIVGVTGHGNAILDALDRTVGSSTKESP
jgi:hypothetical protein